jgi:hypothetical protein
LSGKLLRGFASHHRVTNRFADTRRRESQSAIRIISLQHLIVRFPLPAMRAPKITPPDINRVRKGSRHFCAAGTFCARFRHAIMRTPTAGSSFIRKTEQRRAQFVAEVFDRRRN